MSNPPIHGNRAVFSASTVLRSLGDALGKIRQDDGLTWTDVGKVMGKSEDQAAKYADGSTEMGVFAFASAKREWGSRFTGSFDRLIADSRPAQADDNTIHSKVIRAALAIAEARESGGQIFDWEIRMASPVLEQAMDAIEDLLRRVKSTD